MLKLGPERELTEAERARIRRQWTEEDVTQAELAQQHRISIKRLHLECAGLERVGRGRAPQRAHA